jgi:cytochrome c oxidase assembly protein subunit 11
VTGQNQNARVLAVIFFVAFGMLVLSFASVPLYRTFCQVTGWGGTTQTVAKNEGKVFEREFIVQFNADTDPNMPWVFKPDLRKVRVKVGEDALISYSAQNKSNLPVAGTAIHNVTPALAGKYFNKTQCFCFGQQILQPGQKVHMPVTFFIDPKIMDDHELRDLKTITLSYTFYRYDSPELEKAIKRFYDEPGDSVKRKNHV